MTHTARAIRHPHRLVLRIYLVSLLGALVVYAAFTVTRKYILEPPWFSSLQRQGLYLTDTLARKRAHPAALAEEAQRIRAQLDATLALYRADGSLIYANASPPPAPLPAAALGRLTDETTFIFGTPLTVAAAIREEGRLVGYGLFVPRRSALPLRDAAVFIVITVLGVALMSVFAARALARPLERLARAAQALGSGNLGARVSLDRRDEFGEVARAFNEMADRVEQLLRSQKELLANVSHELRTPLSRIRVALDIASETDAAHARESLGEVAEDLGELERLVEDILTAARFELTAGRAGMASPPLRVERIDAAQLLDKAAARFRASHASQPLSLRVDGPLPAIEADPTLLRRVIDNLLDNAHKYSDENTSVELRARLEGHRLVIEVVDQGIGIDADDLPHVFEPFFRADRSRTRATGGVGLGLALARHVVEAHGGDITIHSVPRTGTTVRFTIPAAPPGAPHSE
jgi:two-component system, OmpR family, sensor kinase